MPFSAPKVKALGVILQNRHGAKFYSKYYTKHSQSDFSKTEYNITTDDGKLKLQKALSQKLKKMNIVSTMTAEKKAEIFSLGGYTILFKVINELYIFLICEDEENFVLMENVINCIGNVLPLISPEQYHQKTIEDNLDSIVICVDEVLDEGIILCLDENQVFDRIKMREGSEKNISVNNKTANKKQQPATTGAFNSLFGFAKNTLQRTLNLG